MLSERSPLPEAGNRAAPISLLICDDAIMDVPCFNEPLTVLVDLPTGEGPKLHVHPYEEVFLIQESCATSTIDSTTLEARAGQIAIVPAGVPPINSSIRGRVGSGR